VHLLPLPEAVPLLEPHLPPLVSLLLLHLTEVYYPQPLQVVKYFHHLIRRHYSIGAHQNDYNDHKIRFSLKQLELIEGRALFDILSFIMAFMFSKISKIY